MSKQKNYYVYIMTNSKNTVLYTGITNNLLRRGFEHKEKTSYHINFTKKYNINKLVYYEVYNNVNDAIDREKQIKGGSRKKKILLIENNNHNWNDLYEELDPVT